MSKTIDDCFMFSLVQQTTVLQSKKVEKKTRALLQVIKFMEKQLEDF